MRGLANTQLRMVIWMCSSTHGRMTAPGMGALGIGQHLPQESGWRTMIVLRTMTRLMIMSKQWTIGCIRISSYIVLRFVSYQSLKFFEFLIIRSVMFFLSLWSWYVSGELR